MSSCAFKHLVIPNRPKIILNRNFWLFHPQSPRTFINSHASWSYVQLKKYYQPRNSHRTVSVNLEGIKVPMYGAASTLTVPPTSSPVPMILAFKIRSRGYVVGQLVRTTHIKQISCPVGIDSTSNKAIVFKKNSCTYEWLCSHLSPEFCIDSICLVSQWLWLEICMQITFLLVCAEIPQYE